MNKKIAIGIGVGVVALGTTAILIHKHVKNVKSANTLFAICEKAVADYAESFDHPGASGDTFFSNLVNEGVITTNAILDYVKQMRCFPAGGKTKIKDLLTRLQGQILKINDMTDSQEINVKKVVNDIQTLIDKL